MRKEDTTSYQSLWDHQTEAIDLALRALDHGGGFGLWHDM